jgi:hypothetical protein
MDKEMIQETRYFSDSLSISFSLPEKWSQEERAEDLVIITGPPIDSTGYLLSTLSLTLTSAKQESEVWIDWLIKDSEKQQRIAYEDYQILHEERFRLAGYWAYLRRVSWRPEGEPDPYYHFQGVLWTEAKSLYVMKGATPDVEILDTMEAIFRSLQLELSSD